MPGISTSKTCIPFGSGGSSWTPQNPLGGETPTLWVKNGTRSGLVMPDSVTTPANDVAILPECVSVYVGTTGITPDENTIWAFKGVLAGALDAVGGSYETNKYFHLARAGTRWSFGWGNTVSQSAGANYVDTNWHLFIIYSKRLWIVDPTTLMTDASLLNVIATVTPILNYTGATWPGLTQAIFYNRLNPTAWGYGDFTFSESYLGNLVAGVITWQAKHIFNSINRVSAATTRFSLYAFDILSGSYVTAQTRVVDPVPVFSTYASRHCLDYGYSLYQKAANPDIQVPFLLSGVKNPTIPAIDGYVWIADFAGNATNHNLASSKLNFAGAEWDRSDDTIFADAARAAGTYYAAGTPKAWHITELNQLAMSDWFEADKEGQIYVHMETNSVESRQSLNELIAYTTRKTGADFLKILKYTGDDSFFFSVDYLIDPYNQVYKISAVTDSEFKFNINGGLVFDEDELYEKFDAMVKLNPSEDLITTAFRFLTNNFGAGIPYTYTLGASQMLTHFNSYPNGVCSDNALIAYQFLLKYFETITFGVKPGHTMNYIPDVAFVDMRLRTLVYKDKYILASLEEIFDDNKIFTEPIRKTTPDTVWYNTNLYSDAYDINDITRNATFELPNSINNLKYKMPAGSNFTFPVLLDDTPRTITAVEGVYGEMTYRGDGVFVATGTGVVEMPFFIVKITGAGSVIVDGVTYDLPDDEAALTEVLQSYEKFYNTFTILTNTGTITAHCIVNHRRLLLYNRNRIEEGIISGDITVERVTTDKPIPTAYLSVDKGTADSWSITYDDYFTTNKTFKVPLTCTIDDTHDRPTIDFFKSGTSRPEPQRYFNATPNTSKSITAGTPVIDKCFAARLDPRDDDFTGSLELTFTIYDGSTCYYTTDGTTPDATKTAYTVPFTISATTTIKWINIRSGYANSHVNTRVITKTA